MMDMNTVLMKLRANGVDVRSVFEVEPDQERIEEYLTELEKFLKSYDFMRLGQSVNHGQWNAAQIKSSGMNRMAIKLGLMSCSRQLQGIRQAAAAKNREEAKQLLSLMISRRVKLMELLKQIRHENPELFDGTEPSNA